MDLGAIVAVALGVLLVVATFVVWKTQGHPPDNDDWPVERITPSEQFYGSVDTPAGPDAESGLPGREADPHEF
jgi:hypothetical protein